MFCFLVQLPPLPYCAAELKQCKDAMSEASSKAELGVSSATQQVVLSFSWLFHDSGQSLCSLQCLSSSQPSRRITLLTHLAISLAPSCLISLLPLAKKILCSLPLLVVTPLDPLPCVMMFMGTPGVYLWLSVQTDRSCFPLFFSLSSGLILLPCRSCCT